MRLNSNWPFWLAVALGALTVGIIALERSATVRSERTAEAVPSQKQAPVRETSMVEPTKAPEPRPAFIPTLAESQPHPMLPGDQSTAQPQQMPTVEQAATERTEK